LRLDCRRAVKGDAVVVLVNRESFRGGIHEGFLLEDIGMRESCLDCRFNLVLAANEEPVAQVAVAGQFGILSPTHKG